MPSSYRLDKEVLDMLQHLSEDSATRYGLKLTRAKILELLIRREHHRIATLDQAEG